MKFSRNMLAAVAVVATVGLFGCGKSTDPTSVSPSLDSTPPSAPEGLSLTSTSEYNTLSWTASSATDLVSYQVYQYQPDPSCNNSYVMIGETTSTSYQISATKADTQTYFRVRAMDTAGNLSAMSTELDAHLPAAPMGGGGPGTSDPQHRISE